jgi:hypothetical protein
MELRHRKAIIQFYIEIRVKQNKDISFLLEKLIKDRFKYWNFETVENEIITYFINLGGTKADAVQRLNEIKKEI